MKNKTQITIKMNDKKDSHFVKISTTAKELPVVLHQAIKLLKKQIEDGNKQTFRQDAEKREVY